MKKTLSIIILSLLLVNITFADTTLRESNDNENYNLYKERIEKYCKSYSDTKTIVKIEKYEKAYDSINLENSNPGYVLDNTIEKYKNDMNKIYNCGMINLKINSNNLILNKLDTNSVTVKELKEQFSTEISKLKILYKNNNCINLDDSVNQKLSILRQTTYETCKYNYYMEYLKSFYENINIDISDSSTSSGAYLNAYNNYVNTFKKKINDATSRSYYLFPLTYHAYIEFENYYPIHILLVLLKQDYINFRLYFYKAINPINQVVYKIANAMSK